MSATESDGKAATGHAVGGVGWYETTLTLDPAWAHRVTFEGAFQVAEVWIDGHLAATQHYSYNPFWVELPAGRATATVTVRIEDLGHNSRWYTGSGLYRPVRIERRGPVAIRPGGLVARVLWEGDRAHVVVDAELDGSASVTLTLVDPQGKIAAGPIEASGDEISVGFHIDHPARWNPWTSSLSSAGEQPLYQLLADVGGLVTEVALGFRDIKVGQDGLFVNGERVLLQGGCIHHDQGVLGACAWPEAEFRKVKLLRDAGYNAIRTSHNPPSEALLEACDQLGMLVLDEIHDEWVTGKCPTGHHRFFEADGLDDARTFVRRDRNRACVWAWSIGNEIFDSYDRPDLALALRNAVLAEDATRPVAAGLCCSFWTSEAWVDWAASSELAAQHLDIVGMNYLWKEVRPDRERHPKRLVMQTETYAFDAWESWQSVIECPWNLGDFVWTAQDYRGESAIGQSFAAPGEPLNGEFPWHLAICGDLDLIGERKPQSFYRESLWRRGVVHATVHAPVSRPKVTQGWHHRWGWDEVCSHWTWPGHEGEVLRVEVYTSEPEVTLTLNGQVVGHRVLGSEDRNRVVFEVPYAPGELVAQAGNATHRLVTAGRAVGVAVESEVIGDLLFARLVMVDENGVRVPTADSLIRVETDGVLLGFGNASPTDLDPVTDAEHRAFQGAALAVVRGDSATIRATL